uniref:Uncharacterized protein n=1 Tax=Pristionchus pacificus TaxID=54126 RepID=A0A2A6BVF6_PRIPA|eukprot:PDM69889.1 hypothetical protein PRIPAC_49101 [Pristionchus pacificus]
MKWQIEYEVTPHRVFTPHSILLLQPERCGSNNITQMKPPYRNPENAGQNSKDKLPNQYAFPNEEKPNNLGNE